MSAIVERVPRRLSRRMRRVLAAAAVLAVVLSTMVVASPRNIAQAADGSVTGLVFEDFNNNGTRDNGSQTVAVYTPFDAGVAGVGVQATDSTGAVVGSATTDVNGLYTLTVTGSATTAIRIEFIKPAGWTDGRRGTNSGTGVQFVDISSPAFANFGMTRPNDYNATVTLPVVSLNIERAVLSPSGLTNNLGASTALVAYNYTTIGAYNTGTQNFSAAGPYVGTLPMASQSQIGSTWGSASYQGNQVMVSAHFKRFAAVGPGGLGQIYSSNVATANGGTMNAVPLVTIPNAGTNPRPAGTEWPATPGTGTYDWFHDVGAFAQVGKIGLGDIDTNYDQTKLYAVNLNDRQVYEVPLGAPVVPNNPPVTGTPVAIALPLSLPGATQGCNQAQVRPFGLGEYGGKLYVTLTCTGPTRADLRGYIYSMDEDTRVFSAAPVLETNLDYTRGAVYTGGNSANFQPWTDTFTTLAGAPYPTQPLLSNVAFSAGGTLTLSIKDRNADQNGVLAGSTTTASNTAYTVNSAGDLLKFCGNPQTGWTRESAGVCGGVTGNAPTIGYGPGGGYFYRTDFSGANNTLKHDHVMLGSAVQIPGMGTLMTTSYNPYTPVLGGNNLTTGYNQAGFRVLAVGNGSWAWAGTLTSTLDANGSNTGDGGFAKAGGLGDLSHLVRTSPIEIGNRVWFDLDKDGIQDAGESPIAGVTVHLYAADGVTLIGTTVTDASGEYYFTNSSTATATANTALVPLGLDTNYVLKLDNPVNYAAGGPLFGLSITQAVAGSDVEVDSNGVATGGFSVATITTRGTGQNDHSFDFGFSPPAYSLGNRLWLDTGVAAGHTNNGLLDADESPVPAGTVVELLNSAGTVIGTQVTDAAGYYRFDALDLGDYRVRVAAINFGPGGRLVGYRSATPAPAAFDLAGNNRDHGVDSATPETTGITSNLVTLTAANVTGEVDGSATGRGLNGPSGDASDNLTVDFGFYLPSVSVGDFVWLDTDLDGIQDPGEMGINNVVMTLTGPGGASVTDIFGNPVGPVQTSGNGGYLFPNLPVLPAGNHYTVTIDSDSPALTGLTPTRTGQGTTANDSETGTAESTDLDTDGASDLTLDFGFVQPYDLMIIKTVTSTGPYSDGAGVTYDLTVTNNGPGVALSGFTVTDVLPIGLSYSGAGASGTNWTCAPAVGQEIVCTWDGPDLASGESTLTPVTVTATVDIGAPVGTSLINVAYVTPSPDQPNPETIPRGTPPTENGDNVPTPTNPSNNDDSGSIVTPTANLFAVGDFVWYDTDLDGVQDGGELPVEAVTVELLNSLGAVIGTTSTNAAGYYIFDSLPAGEYSVRFSDIPPGYAFTPSGAGGDTVLDSNPSVATGLTPTFVLAVGQPNVRPALPGDNVTAAYINPTIDAGIIQPFDLMITKTVTSVGPYTPFSPVGFDLTVTNNGPGSALTGFTVTDVLPTGLLFAGAGASGTNWSCDPPEGQEMTCTWAGPDLAAGASASAITISAAVDGSVAPATTLRNVAYVTPSPLQPNEETIPRGTPPTENGDNVPTPTNPSNNDDSEEITTPPAITFAVGDFVWYDDDLDGVQDSGELPVEAVTVELRNVVGTVIASTTTDAAGYYVFDDLPAGDYSVRFSTLPAGYTFTTPGLGADESLDSNPVIATGVTAPFTLAVGQPNLREALPADNVTATYINPTIDAGIVQPYDLMITKTVTSAGPYSAGSAATFDLTVTNNGPGLALSGFTVTDVLPVGLSFSGVGASGTNWVCAPPTGQQIVCTWNGINLASGATTATPLNVTATVDVGVTAGTALRNVAYVTPSANQPSPETIPLGTPPTENGDNVPTVANPSNNDDSGTITTPSLRFAVGDYMWYDTDSDGVQDAGELPAAGLTVQLLDSGGSVVATTATNGAGYYVFDDLPAGTYAVQFSKPNEYEFTAAARGGDATADSNPDVATGLTPTFVLDVGEPNVRPTLPGDGLTADYFNPTIDAGLVEGQVEPSSSDTTPPDTTPPDTTPPATTPPDTTPPATTPPGTTPPVLTTSTTPTTIVTPPTQPPPVQPPPGTPPLSYTGIDLAGQLGFACALCVVGAGLLFIARRRRSHHH